MSKPKVYYVNHMAMNPSLEEAKDWTPKSEHCDLRAYVLLDDYQALERKLDVEMEALKAWLAWYVWTNSSRI